MSLTLLIAATLLTNTPQGQSAVVVPMIRVKKQLVELSEAMAHKDEARFAKVLTPDFQSFDTDGVRSDRAKVLSDLRKLFLEAKTLKVTTALDRFEMKAWTMVAQTHSNAIIGSRRVKTTEEQTWVRVDGKWKLKQVRTIGGEAWRNGEFDPLPGGPEGSRGWLGISPVRIIKERHLAD